MATAHQLTITLQEVEPPIWRRLLVPSACTLSEVQEVLLLAMGWAGYHLSEFHIGSAVYAAMDDDAPEETLDAASVRLGDLVGPGASFTFDYDFGDGWSHRVVVDDVVPLAGASRPVCLDGRRACPPEDVGGPWGYADFLDAIRDPEHDDHDEMIEWIGGSFDPEAFDAAVVDRLLAGRT